MIRGFTLAGALMACLTSAPVRAQQCGRLGAALDLDNRGMAALSLQLLPRGGGIAINAAGASLGLSPAQECTLASEDGTNELSCRWQFEAQERATAAFDSLLERMRRCLGPESMQRAPILASANAWRPVQRNVHEIERAPGGSTSIALQLVEYIAQAQAGVPPTAAVYYLELNVSRDEN